MYRYSNGQIGLSDFQQPMGMRLRDLLYAETDGHYLIFHTAEGQIRQCGTISTLEADLTNKQFVRCNSCYLVNLQHIAGIKGYSLLLDNGEELKISQPRKKQVQQTYNEYLMSADQPKKHCDTRQSRQSVL